MNKTFRTVGLMSIAVMSLTLAACGGDEENSDNSSNMIPITKHLIRITRDDNIIIDYTYDNLGRVTQIQRTMGGNSSVSETYSYDNNSIIETVFDMGTSWENKYTLENGVIVKAFDGDTKVTTIYSYDNGYLSKESESNNHYQDYIWIEGNLMSHESDSGTKETYEYTNIVAPQGFFPIGHLWSSWGMGCYFGKSSQYLPSSYREGKIYITYDWTINDGLPTKMIRDSKVAPSTGITTFTFEWK